MTDFRRIFIDTSPMIYYLENNAFYAVLIKNFFAKCFREDIQLVTSSVAVVSGCDVFFTNDKQLRQEKELPCMTMDDIRQNLEEQWQSDTGR